MNLIIKLHANQSQQCLTWLRCNIGREITLDDVAILPTRIGEGWKFSWNGLGLKDYLYYWDVTIDDEKLATLFILTMGPAIYSIEE